MLAQQALANHAEYLLCLRDLVRTSVLKLRTRRFYYTKDSDIKFLVIFKLIITIS